MSEELAQPALPGMPVTRATVWREHTAERWLRDDPESYAECIDSVRRGELNKSHLAEKFRVSRNSVRSLIMREFSVDQLREVTAKAAMMAAADGVEKSDELIDKAKAAKDLPGKLN